MIRLLFFLVSTLKDAETAMFTPLSNNNFSISSVFFSLEYCLPSLTTFLRLLDRIFLIFYAYAIIHDQFFILTFDYTLIYYTY